MTGIVSFLDEELFLNGILDFIPLDFDAYPHMLLTGVTGSGKTYAGKLLLGKIAYYIPDAQIFLADFKGQEFRFCTKALHFYEFMDCAAGLNTFYDAFYARQRGEDSSTCPLFLFFDEYASYLNFLDKKEMEDVKRKISTLLMMGRSYECHVIISIQRADAEYFGKSRDNFSIILGLGNQSKEAKAMLFDSVKDDMPDDRGRGRGYLLLGGSVLKKVLVPPIRSAAMLETCIRRAVGFGEYLEKP